MTTTSECRYRWLRLPATRLDGDSSEKARPSAGLFAAGSRNRPEIPFLCRTENQHSTREIFFWRRLLALIDPRKSRSVARSVCCPPAHLPQQFR